MSFTIIMNDPVKIKLFARLMLLAYEHFRQLIVVVLMVLMVSVSFAVLEGVVAAKTMLLSLRESFAGVLLVLLGLGLMESVKIYLPEESVHVEVVLLVALIAISQFAAPGLSNGRSALTDRACCSFGRAHRRVFS